MTSRRHIYVRRAAPKPQLGALPDLNWVGHLVRTGGAIKAELSDTHGWRLVFTVIEHHEGTHLVLRGRIAAAGYDMPPWLDQGLRGMLMERVAPGMPGVDTMPVPGVLQLRDGAWSGWIGATERGGGIRLTAEPDGPGRLALRGLG